MGLHDFKDETSHVFVAQLELDEDYRTAITFPVFGWGATDGATREEALYEAKDLLRELISTTTSQGRDLPRTVIKYDWIVTNSIEPASPMEDIKFIIFVAFMHKNRLKRIEQWL